MEATTGSNGLGRPENGYTLHPDTSAAEAALRAKLNRKRTKTGCLTCRKRRIKCGEERPVCRNCVKSKRSCEGYSQRVIFKPTFDFRTVPNGGAHITFQSQPDPGSGSTWAPGYGHAGQTPTFYAQAPATPDLVQQHRDGLIYQHPFQFVHTPPAHPGPPPSHYFVPQQLPQQHDLEATASIYPGSHLQTPQLNGVPQQLVFLSHQGSFLFPGATIPAPVSWHAPHVDEHTQKEIKYEPPPDRSPTMLAFGQYQASPSSSKSSHTMPGNPTTAFDNRSPPWPTNGYVPRPELVRPIDYRPPQYAPPSHTPSHDPSLNRRPIQHDGVPDLYEHEQHVEPAVTPTSFLQQAAVEQLDTDYWDVQSDDDEELHMQSSLLVPGDSNRHHSFQKIIAVNKINIQDMQTRRYDTFIYDGIIERYQPDEVANPLGNEATARLFLHFIAVTGPSLSIYERQVRNTSMLFADHEVRFSQQGLWTYTMPLAALRNKGLLHAMLALASLHVARLTRASETPSMQHYVWALKRIHASVGDERKRYKLTTIAASMLLGFYEILTADHVKWNTHLSGSSQLFLETDFSTMTRQFRRMKAERASRRKGKRKHSLLPQQIAQEEILDQVYDVDQRLVSEISGKEVNYDTHGQIMAANVTIPQELDLSKFEILRDLYWWYLKQDAYQSIVSGNALLLNYHKWTDCPPRAPLGKADAVYGSFDHLVLLLGRIADFSSRDRKRKLNVMEANGGQWRPGPGTKMAPPPQGAPPTPVSATGPRQPNGMPFTSPPGPPGGAPVGPQFYGMAPPPRQNVQMPPSYNTHAASYSNHSSLPTPETMVTEDPMDLQAALDVALKEYGRIRAALHTFASSLGEPFKPLTAEHQPPLETPFGSALFYRSYDIGCLWSIFYMAMIIAIRSNPHMHPAAHVAAAMMAEDTRFFANEIGRITAGIVPGPANQPLNPTLGAALCESCMPSFFAAIQYQKDDQRRHTIHRIQGIAQRTGWATADLIANGCETAWVKAAAAGRGAPYTRVARNEYSEDPRLNGSWERLDPSAPPDEKDESDRRLVATKPNARLQWAIGIMGTEDDERRKVL